MPAPGDRSAREAIDDFIRHLADRQFTITTRRIRRHYLDEYLQHAQEAAGAIDIAVSELMDRARTGAWLSDAAAGKTRTRNTLRGPGAAAYPNSMRVRIDSYNAFAEFLRLSERHDSQPPTWGYYLTPADTERLLHDLAVRRPVHANAATSLRTAAVAALVADTSRTVPELARLNISALHLDGEARVELADGFCPLERRDRADPNPVARCPSGDHRRTRGQRPGYLGSRPSPGGPEAAASPSSPASRGQPSVPSTPLTVPSSAKCSAHRSVQAPSVRQARHELDPARGRELVPCPGHVHPGWLIVRPARPAVRSRRLDVPACRLAGWFRDRTVIPDGLVRNQRRGEGDLVRLPLATPV